MSLNRAEQRATADELQENLERTGLSRVEIAAALDWDEARLDAALEVGANTDPVDVWKLRDHLLFALEDAGVKPAPFTVLTDARKKEKAKAWFPQQ